MKKFISDARSKKIPFSDYGYNQVSVDELIDQILDKFELILQENEKLKDVEKKLEQASKIIEEQEEKLKYFKSINNEDEVFEFKEFKDE